jgi:hypothetical protein
MSPGALAALHVEAFSEGPGAGNGLEYGGVLSSLQRGHG